MSESIVIQAVYIAIGPFFVLDSTTDSKGREKKDNAILNTLGPSAMRGLRLEALSLIRSVSMGVPQRESGPNCITDIRQP